MENRNCPICINPYPCKTLPIPEPEEIVGHNTLCTNCGLIYHNPVMTQQEMIDYYSKEFSGEYHESRDMQEDLANNRVNFLKKHLSLDSVGHALEVGCAYGDFVAALVREGVDAIGIEASETLSRVAREDRGVEVHTTSVEDFSLQEKHYGLVSMFHVLEHFHDPLAVLKLIRKSLREDGWLYIEVPTVAESQLAQVFKIIHPTTFVASTLQLMLEKAGFEVTSVEAKGYNLVALAKLREGEATEFTLTEPESIYREAEEYLKSRQKVLQKIEATMGGLADKKKVAVYGAGHNTIDLDEVYSLSNIAFDSIYDADPAKHGKEMLGKHIRPPEALESFDGDTVIISTYKFQEEVLENLSYLKARGVELVTLYDKSL